MEKEQKLLCKCLEIFGTDDPEQWKKIMKKAKKYDDLMRGVRPANPRGAGRKGLEEEKADQHDTNGVGDAQPDGPGDAVGPAGPVVISHNGHHAVVQTEDRHEEKGLQLEVYPQHRCGGGGEGDQNLVHAEHHD